LRYRYTSLYAIEGGFSASDQDQELVIDTGGGFRAILTSKAAAYALEVDKSLALAGLLLRGLFRSEPRSPEFRQRLLDATDEVREVRETNHGPGPTLVIVGEGEMEALGVAHEADAGEFMVCFDCFDKTKIRASFQSRISALISSIRIVTPDVTALKKLGDAVVGFREDGRPVYSYTATAGSVRLLLSRQMTNEQLLALRDLYAGFMEDSSLERVHRLLQSSLETNDDKLRSYLAAWWAFEIFLGSRSQSHRRVRIPERFAELSAKLSPQSADQDVATVTALETTRNKLLHGEPVDEATLPVEGVREVLSRYLRLSAASSI
jgi:hypothetical protein